MRQNVVVELCYFIGKLGRDRAAVLKEAAVETPSDVEGITYISFPEGNLKLEVMTELEAQDSQLIDPMRRPRVDKLRCAGRDSSPVQSHRPGQG
jgi:hypothetical protein